MTLRIDPEFHALIPPLTPEEYAALEASIVAEGVRDDITKWGDIIVDGHNRYEICTKHSIPFKTAIKDFPDRDAAMLWMIQNQFSRRNLNAMQRAELALQMEPLIAKQAKAHQIAAGGALPQKSANPIETRRIVAKAANISHDTVDKVKRVIASPVKELARMTRTGAVSINAAEALAKAPESVQRAAVEAGPDAVKAKAKALRTTGASHRFAPEVPAHVRKAFEADSLCTDAANLLRQLMGCINAICGDGKDRQPSICAVHLSPARQEMTGHVDELRRWMRFGRPAQVCPYCCAKDKACTVCKGGGYVGEDQFEQAPPEMKAKVKEWIK